MTKPSCIIVGYPSALWKGSAWIGLMQEAMSFNDAVIVSVKGNYYRVRFWYISMMNLLKHADLSKRSRLFEYEVIEKSKFDYRKKPIIF